MRYDLLCYCYDFMDQCSATLSVRRIEEGDPRPTETVLQVTTTYRGQGESDPREWAKDALIALLESL
jgi:hypothetical protein